MPVGQPARPPEPGLVHPQHPLARDRPARPRPGPPPRAAPSATTPVRDGDLRLIPPVLHRHRQRRPQPRHRARARRDLPDLLGERPTRTRHRAAAPAPLAPLHHRELAPARQIPRAGQHPVLPRRRAHSAHRAAGRVRIGGHQLNDLDSGPGTHDTLHRQTLESQQARRIIATVNSPLAAPEHSEDHRVAGRPRSGAPHGPNLRLPGQDL
jgi:hypothetical protein